DGDHRRHTIYSSATQGLIMSISHAHCQRRRYVSILQPVYIGRSSMHVSQNVYTILRLVRDFWQEPDPYDMLRNMQSEPLTELSVWEVRARWELILTQKQFSSTMRSFHGHLITSEGKTMPSVGTIFCFSVDGA